MRSLILGGMRSGKSAYAERCAAAGNREVVYIATAQAHDQAMRERIDRHRARRPVSWSCAEEPLALASALEAHARLGRTILVDCLTLWLTNLLCDPDPDRFDRERAALLGVVPALPGEVVFVSTEVGLGVIPMGELSRRFVDEAGRLHQDLAALCERVVFVAAGLPLAMKGALA